eukprot:6904098-Pyramimonas_sp.AAC.1
MYDSFNKLLTDYQRRGIFPWEHQLSGQSYDPTEGFTQRSNTISEGQTPKVERCASFSSETDTKAAGVLGAFQRSVAI